jgi:hypothetical protein
LIKGHYGGDVQEHPPARGFWLSWAGIGQSWRWYELPKHQDLRVSLSPSVADRVGVSCGCQAAAGRAPRCELSAARSLGVVGAGHEIGGSPREPLAACDVAVFECCTPDRIGGRSPARNGLPGADGVKIGGFQLERCLVTAGRSRLAGGRSRCRAASRLGARQAGRRVVPTIRSVEIYRHSDDQQVDRTPSCAALGVAVAIYQERAGSCLPRIAGRSSNYGRARGRAESAWERARVRSSCLSDSHRA